MAQLKNAWRPLELGYSKSTHRDWEKFCEGSNNEKPMMVRPTGVEPVTS